MTIRLKQVHQLEVLYLCCRFECQFEVIWGHKGVKGQLYKDAPNELKFINSNSYDIISILKLPLNRFKVKGHFKILRLSWHFYTMFHTPF